MSDMTDIWVSYDSHMIGTGSGDGNVSALLTNKRRRQDDG